MRLALILAAVLALNGCFFSTQLPTTASRAPITRTDRDGKEKQIGSHKRSAPWSVYGEVTVLEW